MIANVNEQIAKIEKGMEWLDANPDAWDWDENHKMKIVVDNAPEEAYFAVERKNRGDALMEEMMEYIGNNPDFAPNLEALKK